MKKPFYTRKELKILREALSRTFNITPQQRGDFKKLQEKINERLKEKNIRCKGKGGQEEYVRIGETSIQYLWNYRKNKKNYACFTKSTLNKFVQSLTPPYEDWTDFTEKTDTSSKNAVFPEDINVKNLKKGKIITLGLAPDYFAEIKYLGEYKFEILKTEGLNRKEGDTIKAYQFIRTSVASAASSHATPSILFKNEDGKYTDLDTQKGL